MADPVAQAHDGSIDLSKCQSEFIFVPVGLSDAYGLASCGWRGDKKSDKYTDTKNQQCIWTSAFVFFQCAIVKRRLSLRACAATAPQWRAGAAPARA